MNPPMGGPTSGPIRAGIVNRAMAPQEFGLGNETQHDDATDRNHQRAAETLQGAGGHQGLERLRKAAGERGEREYGDGGAEHGAGAEPVGTPPADGNEDGKTEEIGG